MGKERFGVGHQQETLGKNAVNDPNGDSNVHQRMENEEPTNEEKVFDVAYNEIEI